MCITLLELWLYETREILKKMFDCTVPSENPYEPLRPTLSLSFSLYNTHRERQPGEKLYLIELFRPLIVRHPISDHPSTRNDVQTYFAAHRQTGQYVFAFAFVVHVQPGERVIGIGDLSGVCRQLHEKKR